MSWTAYIIDVRPMPSGQEAVCVLTDGVSQKFQQSYQTDGTLASLLPQVRATVAKTDLLSGKPELTIGLALDLTPPVMKVTSPPDPVLVQFQSDLSALRREVRAVSDGLKTGNDLVTLQTTVQKTLDANPSFGSEL